MRKLQFNEQAYNEELAARQVLVDSINELGRELKDEGVKFNSEILRDYMKNRIIESPYREGEKMTYTASILVDATLSKVGRKAATKLFLRGLTDHAEVIAKELSIHRESISTNANQAGTVPESIPFNGDKAAFTEKESELLQEKHTFYLRPEDEELYEKVEQFSESLAEMNLFLQGKLLFGEHNLSDALIDIGGGAIEPRWNFLRLDGETSIPNPEFFGTRQKRIDHKNPLS